MATTIPAGSMISPSGDPSAGPTGMPIGAVVDFVAPEAGIPSGWLICDGRLVSRASYAALFDVIGIGWGAGDGSSTFALPDLRGFAVAGLDNMGGVNAGRLSSAGVQATTLGGSMGADTCTLAVANLPSHTHSYAWSLASQSGLLAGANYNPDNGSNTWAVAAGQGGAHNNIQWTRGVNKIIRFAP